MLNPRWNDPDLVAEFAERDTDHRLKRLVESMDDPSSLRFLDLGCAAGRNTIFLANLEADVEATDLSEPMVDLTRERLAEIIGEKRAEGKVHLLPMTDLSVFESSTFDFVVALGIHQQAASLEEWELAMNETVRVMKPAALLLMAHFGVGTDLTGEHGKPTGSPHLYEIRAGHPSILFDETELDHRIADHGLVPIEPTERVDKPHEGGGRRVTINALYRKEE